MRRTLTGLIVLAALAAACSTEDPAPPTSAQGVPQTTPSTTPAPAPATTEPPATVTTSGSSTTTPPPATTSTTTTTVPIGDVEFALEPIADGFSQPVFLTAPPGDPRLFVVDQVGIVWVIDGADPEVFLDIRADVDFVRERGLLGLAFHPDYSGNGLFYVNYTGRDGATNVVEFAVSADPNRAESGSRAPVITVDQPAANHNGGMVAFGPEGNLWIGLGDGGGANDRFGQGQRTDTLLGALLRLRVGPGIDGYEIPADNPFVNGGGAPEVWAIGLRNPWRFDFGALQPGAAPLVVIADVGQNRIEEVDIAGALAGGLNYGWPIMEGDECFESSDCDRAGLVTPAAQYSHSVGCSVTGGFLYEGSAIPSLRDHFVYGDYCQGWIGALAIEQIVGDAITATEVELFPPGTARNLTSFGEDAAGELYVLTADGRVRKLVSAG